MARRSLRAKLTVAVIAAVPLGVLQVVRRTTIIGEGHCKSIE